MSESQSENSEKPSGIRPPSVRPSGIKPPSAIPGMSRISRPCTGHSTPKPGPPPLEPKSE